MERFYRFAAAAAFVFQYSTTFALDCTQSIEALNGRPIELESYETIRDIGLKPTLPISGFQPVQGLHITKRDGAGRPIEAIIRVLSDNRENQIQILGDFNQWNKEKAIWLHPVGETSYFEGTITGITHQMQYRLMVNGKEVLDPASQIFSSVELNEKTGRENIYYLNSVFWDSEGMGKYVSRAPVPHLHGKPAVITEVEVFDLVRHWRYQNVMGPERKSDTYNFVADSGIINEIKNAGINAIEFLPFNTSNDGSDWQLRYQVYGLFGPDSRYGLPSEFARMVDQFNQAGIAVIMDAVVSHYPFSGNGGVRDISGVGPHVWKKQDGHSLYGQVLTEWGTYRYDYSNPLVRRFLIDGVLTMLKNYGVGGIRLDNYDGIKNEPGGEQFISELMNEIRAYRPEVLAISEMFTNDSRITQRIDEGGIGVNARVHSQYFDFIKDYAQKTTEQIDMNRLRQALRTPWLLQEAARVAYITNHDEAANRRDGATGAYFATLVNGGGWSYVEGKTRAFAALAMLSNSFYMDMFQMRLLQEGSMNSNPSVEWELKKLDSPSHLYKFFADLSKYYVSREAFAFTNLHGNIENHIDEINKVITLERIDFKTGRRIYVIINLGHKTLENYKFGINVASKFDLVIDSDSLKYGGSGTLTAKVSGHALYSQAGPLHDKPYQMNIPAIAPYSVTVIEQR